MTLSRSWVVGLVGCALGSLCATVAGLAADEKPGTVSVPAAEFFEAHVRPVLAENCSACHNPNNPRNRINFLKAATAVSVPAGAFFSRFSTALSKAFFASATLASTGNSVFIYGVILTGALSLLIGMILKKVSK